MESPMAEPDPDDHFHAVCEVDDVPDLRPKHVEVADRDVLLCKTGGELYAVDEICPHENKSMRYGVVQRGQIVCPHHQYRFELESGRCRRRCAPVEVYETKIEDGTVYVRVPRVD
jgi:nitrite reductase/ring-hydroxylating ferredoxin subunit